MKQIDYYTNILKDFIYKYIPENIFPYVIYIIIFLIIFITFTKLFINMKKNHFLSNSLSSFYNSLENSNRTREKENKNDFINDETFNGQKKSFFRMLDNKLIYSRLTYYFPFLTTEIYLVIILCSMVIVYFILQFITKNFSTGLIGSIITLGIYMGIQSFMSYHNYKAVEDDLLDFLNLLKNYSISTNEITLIFHKISKYMRNPLSSLLEECYYESQTTGNNSLALKHLMNKVEHPKFKELIRNLEICGRYDSDYAEVLNSSRKTIQNYISAKKEQKAENKLEKNNFVILTIGCIICIYLITNLMKINIIQILTTTTSGKILGTIFIGIIILFIWNVVLFDKD